MYEEEITPAFIYVCPASCKTKFKHIPPRDSVQGLQESIPLIRILIIPFMVVLSADCQSQIHVVLKTVGFVFDIVVLFLNIFAAFQGTRTDTVNPNWLRVSLAFGTSALLWGLVNDLIMSSIQN